ncbi:PTAC2 [Symbiodinium natans]|uniref:PTAC2 protein n=1 Tax=Symbiodinium natans TaxID=878477 RepID=A0A812GQ95_9DINO|nr:PTAC2 [Symbiodinium natans]
MPLATQGTVHPKANPQSKSWEVLLSPSYRASWRASLYGAERGFKHVIAAYSRAQRWQKATSLLLYMRCQDFKVDSLVTCSAIMKTCSRVQRWQRAAGLFCSMQDEGILPDAISFGILLSAHQRKHSWQRSECVLKAMRRMKALPNQICLHSAALASAAGGRWQIALNTLTSPGALCSKDLASFNGMILCFERGGKWKSAAWLLNRLGAWRLSPDEVGASAYVNACGKNRIWQIAAAVLDSAAGISIDTVLCNAALDAYARAGAWLQACSLFHKMCRMYPKQSNRSKGKGSKPDEISSSTLLATCERASQWKPQLAILSLCRDTRLPLRVGALNVVLRSGRDPGMRWAWSLQMLADMQSGTSGFDVGSLKSSAQVCVESRSWKHGVALCLGQSRDVKSFVAAALPECSKWQMGLAIHAPSPVSVLPAYQWWAAVGVLGLSCRLRAPSTKLACSSAISCCGKAQAWLEALFIFHRADAAGMQIDVAALNSAVTASGNGRVWQLGLLLRDSLQRLALSADNFSLTAVLGCVAHSTRWDLALGLRRSSSRHRSPTELSAIVNCCDIGKEWLIALRLLRAAPAADLASVSAAVSACGKHSAWQPASLLLHGTASAALQVDVLIYDAAMAACSVAESHLSSPAACCDRWALGSHLLNLMSESWISASVFSTTGVMTTFSRDSQWRLAVTFLEALQMQAMRSNTSHSIDSTVYNAAISACEKAGEWRVGCLLLNNAEITSLSQRISYHAAISALEKGAEWAGAFQMMKRMQSFNLEADLTGLNAAISAFQRAREWCQACVALGVACSKALCDEITLSTVVSACEKAGEWQQALALLLCAPSYRALLNQIMMNAVISACEKGERRHGSSPFLAEHESSA